MRTEYTVSTSARPTVPASRSLLRNAGIACAASGLLGIVIGIVSLSYPAAVASDRWSYPFGANAQWVVSIVLAVTHLLTLAGFLGIIAARPHGRSRIAALGLWVAMVGYAGLGVCELLSGAVGTRSNDSSMAGAVSGAFGVMSLLSAVGSIVAGVVIVRRCGLRNIGWSMVLWSGIVMIVLVTPANISDNHILSLVTLMVWSVTFVPLGYALVRRDAGAR